MYVHWFCMHVCAEEQQIDTCHPVAVLAQRGSHSLSSAASSATAQKVEEVDRRPLACDPAAWA